MNTATQLLHISRLLTSFNNENADFNFFSTHTKHLLNSD